MTCRKIYPLIVVLLFVFFNASAQELEYEHFTDRDGLPSMQTYEIIQDSTGLLWIGTENGLVSFDGNEFTRFSHPDLIDNDIVHVALSRTGKIYFLNLSQQLCYLENGEITFLNTETITRRIVSIKSTKEKDYIIVVDKWENKAIEIQENELGEVEFIETEIALFHVDNSKVFKKDKKEFIGINNSDSIVMKSDGMGFHKTTTEYNVFRDRRQKLQIHAVDESFYQKYREEDYLRIIKHRSGYFIIRTEEVEFYDFESKSYSRLLTGITVNTIFIDFENNIWLSTASEGLLKVSNRQFESKNNEYLTDIGINEVYQGENGNIYLGTMKSKLIINPTTDRKVVKISNKIRPVWVTEYNGKIYSCDENRFLILDSENLEDSTFYNYNIKPKSLLFDNGYVYSENTYALLKNTYAYYFSPDYKYSQEVFLDGSRISKIFKHKGTNTIYVGSSNGLAYSKQDTFVFVDNPILRTLNITSIIEGDNNSIWIGTRTRGIFNFRNDSIINYYDVSKGIISNNVNNISKSGSELLVSTIAGLSIVDLTNDEIKTINRLNYLPSNDVMVSKVINRDYWIGTLNGLVILSQSQVEDLNQSGPILTLKNLFVNGNRTAYSKHMKLKHSENTIRLQFQNISFNSDLNKQVKYRIPSIDSLWATTTDDNIRLPSLQSGKYQIECVGINAIGQPSKSIHIFFEIDSPWWNKPWVRIFGSLALFGLVYLVIQVRGRRIRREESTKREYLTQINKIKDQALQLQMNPHFIFNSLNAIQGFIGTDEEEKAMNFLARFARLIRLIFEHSKGNTISLEEELEFMQLYLDLEKLRFRDKVEINVGIDPVLEANKDIIDVPPLLIQPIVENSFKHGLFHKKEKGHLTINYTLKNDLLEVIIEDDGVGRKKSEQIQNRDAFHNSSGIKTTQERIDLLNFASRAKKNRIEVVDLLDENGKPAGTKTIIYLSINKQQV